MNESVQVDTSETPAAVDRRDENRATLGHGYMALPYDLPVNIEVRRHLGRASGDDARALLGWSLGIGVTLGPDIIVKIQHGGSNLVVVHVGEEQVWRGSRHVS